jgi:hypothetical protein
MPYMDLSKPYYNKMYNDTYYLRDNLYFFASDMTFPCQSAVKWMVNDEMLVDLGYEADFLFEKVESGDWNLPLIWDMIEGVAVDVNGDGVEDVTDKHGIGSDCWQLAPLWPAAGLKGCYYTEDGFEFDYGTDYSYEVFNEILELQRSPDVKFSGDGDAWFYGNALFTVSGQELRLFYDMEFDFSVLLCLASMRIRTVTTTTVTVVSPSFLKRLRMMSWLALPWRQWLPLLPSTLFPPSMRISSSRASFAILSPGITGTVCSRIGLLPNSAPSSLLMAV